MFIGGGFNTNVLDLGSGSQLQVGNIREIADNEATTVNELESHTGSAQVNTVNVSGGSIKLNTEYFDSDFDLDNLDFNAKQVAPATLAIGSFADSKDKSDAGVIKSDIFVGCNAVMGVGLDSLKELNRLAAYYKINYGDGYGSAYSLDPNNVGAMMYLNKRITVGDGYGITMTTKGTDFLDYYNNNRGAQSPDLDPETLTAVNTFYLGNNTGIVIAEPLLDDIAYINAMGKINPDAKSLITFESKDGTVIADGGRLELKGNSRLNTHYKVFDDADEAVSIEYLDGTTYDIAKETIEVSTPSGVLTAYLAEDGTFFFAELPMHAIEFYVDPDPDPDPDPEDPDDPDDPGKDPRGGDDQPDPGLQTVAEYLVSDPSNFNPAIVEAYNLGDGRSMKMLMRTAVYSGAVQAGLMAGQNNADAVAKRMAVERGMSGITWPTTARALTCGCCQPTKTLSPKIWVLKALRMAWI